MKILFIGTSASTVYGFRADLLQELLNHGHDIYACANDYTNEERKKVIDMGVTPIDYTFDRAGLNPFSDIYNTYKLTEIIQRIAPDLVFSYFAKPVIFGTIAAKFARVRVCIGMLEGLGYVFTEQSSKSSLKAIIVRKITVLLYKVALPLLNKLIFLNHDDPNDLLIRHKIKTKSVCVVSGIGVNLDKYNYIKYEHNGLIRFVFIGRLLKEKGVNEYVQAAKILKKKYINTEFVILGGVDEQNPGGLSSSDLSRLIEEGICIYPGYVSDVQTWIASASVFVLPSYREGLPRSTQEAMAIGRAVITTDVPGCRETVVNGKNGFLIPVRSVDALVQAMEKFVVDPNLIGIMGKASRDLAEQKYDVKNVNAIMLSEMGCL
ncbi:MAG: glycosyltransferase family 4 protein [Agitococcus sp.]|nr:glycosyltransferase family 4 protein [Agitococcus sp.]